MGERPASAGLDARAIRAWRTRVLTGLFLGGFAEALGVVAGVAVAVLLALRAFGVFAPPSAAWLVWLAIPVAWGVRRSQLGRPSDVECAVPLDRRLGLSGWLVTGLEASTGAWGRQAASRLAASDVRSVLPRVRVARLLARGLPSLALLGGVCLLPPPAAAGAGGENPAITEALRHLEERLDALAVEPRLEEKAPDPIRERLEDLRKEAEKGKEVAWADVDAVSERLERKTEERAAALEKARSALERAAGGSAVARDGATKSELLAAGLEAAMDAGLLATLPPELAKALAEQAAAGGKLDPAALGLDAATLDKLAKALSATAGQKLGELAKSGLVDPARLAALERLLASDPKANPFQKGDRICPKCLGKRPEGCGT